MSRLAYITSFRLDSCVEAMELEVSSKDVPIADVEQEGQLSRCATEKQGLNLFVLVPGLFPWEVPLGRATVQHF